jgi:hypothetical protein
MALAALSPRVRKKRHSRLPARDFLRLMRDNLWRFLDADRAADPVWGGTPEEIRAAPRPQSLGWANNASIRKGA